MIREQYVSGEYLLKNPLWHADESPWKAKYVLQMLARHQLAPSTICDVGCGAGEVLRLVHEGLGRRCRCCGYELSPQALPRSRRLPDDGLEFKLADIREEPDAHYDLMLLMDVLEHVEDCFSFLRDLKSKAEYKLIHIPLDISVRNVLLGKLRHFHASYGHLHYFTKELALEMLRDVGYDVIDCLYTWQVNSLRYVWNENKQDPLRLARRVAGYVARATVRLPVRVLFALHQDWGPRIGGQWRLLVLAR
ncbi:MAG TPA: class I SAM-dependent methyltransferase [Gemmatimonadales bacterium]|nr:class I SAM-dependent methyltransferase [Gemmatimonadales bacterium]